MFLIGAQLAGAPLSMLVSAVMGRYLGPTSFGKVYLASQLVSLGFLFVDWGHAGVLPAAVARDRTRAAVLLGTSLTWRLGMTAVVSVVLLVASLLLGYERAFLIVLALVVAQFTLASANSACQDTIRGFERTDISALGQVGQSLFSVLFVVPTLLLGGGVNAVLIAQAAGAAVVLSLVVKVLRRIGIGVPKFQREVLTDLLRQGSSFLVFGAAMALQSNIDAVLLSKLAPAEAVGWQAAANRLSGTLVMPAAALTTALYPTLSRLYTENRVHFLETTRSALKGALILAVPIAICCGVYREVGIQIFSKRSFGPAGDNLIVQSGLLLLVYFSMPLGCSLLAAGRQRIWGLLQFICVAVSSVLDPLLIPWFQRHYGNGGLGVCVAGVVSEVGMVSAGVILAPTGLFDRNLILGLWRGVVAGAAMLAVARLLSSVTPFVAAPLSVLAYLACLRLIGGLGEEQLAVIRGALQRKVAARQ